MPPCKKVLLNKVVRTKYLSKIIKSATENSIERPGKGWMVNENQFMEIDYFDGDPFPEDIVEENNFEPEDDENDENDENDYYSDNESDEYEKSDESDEFDGSDEEWQLE